MGEGQNPNPVRVGSICDSVGKPIGQGSTDWRIQRRSVWPLWPGQGRLSNDIEPLPQLDEEVIAQARDLVVVPRSRFEELCFSFGVKLNLHERRSRSRWAIRLRAVSQSTGSTEPSSSSLARRASSLTQAASASASAGPSRLRKRSWTSLARSLVGSVSAALSSSSVLMSFMVPPFGEDAMDATTET